LVLLSSERKRVPMALRAANSDEEAGPLDVARAFSRPCRHSCRHVFGRVFKGAVVWAFRIPHNLHAAPHYRGCMPPALRCPEAVGALH
jgi:hypothetical protein